MPRTRIEAAELKRLADAVARVEICLSSADLARLSELLVFDQPGEAACDAGPASLDARIRFDQGPEGFPRLHIAVTGTLRLRCQRCLHAIEWPVDLVTQLTVIDDDKCIQQLARPFDSIVMQADGVALETVIEDEVLAMLPMAPMHGARALCAEAGGLTVEFESDKEQETGQTYHPFATLATIVGNGGDGRDD